MNIKTKVIITVSLILGIIAVPVINHAKILISGDKVQENVNPVPGGIDTENTVTVSRNLTKSDLSPSELAVLEDLRSRIIIWSHPYPEIEINHEELLSQNEDYLFWMKFDFDVPGDLYDIFLSEPVPFETEPDWYLHHDFQNNPDNNGCIFMDYQSEPSLYGYNDFLYAHHASNGTLFGTLEKIYQFGDKEWLANHPQYLYLYTKTACHKYALIGYERVKDSNDHYAYTTCENEEMYLEYVDYLQHLPDYIPSSEVQWDTEPELLNFSTCNGEPGTTKRFVVHFAKILAYSYN